MNSRHNQQLHKQLPQMKIIFRKDDDESHPKKEKKNKTEDRDIMRSLFNSLKQLDKKIEEYMKDKNDKDPNNNS